LVVNRLGGGPQAPKTSRKPYFWPAEHAGKWASFVHFEYFVVLYLRSVGRANEGLDFSLEKGVFHFLGEDLGGRPSGVSLWSYRVCLSTSKDVEPNKQDQPGSRDARNDDKRRNHGRAEFDKVSDKVSDKGCPHLAWFYLGWAPASPAASDSDCLS
jgi:hypothetical protein